MVLILSVAWKSWKDYTSLIQYFLVLQVDTMLVDSSTDKTKLFGSKAVHGKMLSHGEQAQTQGAWWWYVILFFLFSSTAR
jgi:hypothetical protein